MDRYLDIWKEGYLGGWKVTWVIEISMDRSLDGWML